MKRQLSSTLTLGLALLLGATGASAQMYKWTDAKGGVHFSDQPPPPGSDRKVEQLLANAGIIRNRAKINAAINNARCFIAIQEAYGSFDTYCWGFVGGAPIINRPRVLQEVPATSSISDALAKDLKQRGFKFLGSTIVYAHMQATGMVNDHLVDCFRHREVQHA